MSDERQRLIKDLLAEGDRDKVIKALARLLREEEEKRERLERLRSLTRR